MSGVLAPVLPTPAVRGDALVGEPEAFRGRARLPEDVDGDAAAGVPVAADAQPAWRGGFHDALADGQGAVLVEGAVVAEGAQVELQRLGLDQPFRRRVVD